MSKYTNKKAGLDAQGSNENKQSLAPRFRGVKVIWLTAALLVVSAIACNLPLAVDNNPQPMPSSPVDVPIMGQEAVPTLPVVHYVTVGPPLEPTPTPFMPLDPTATTILPSATPTPSWGNYPGPTVYSEVEIPPPVDAFQQPAGQLNVLLLGSDLRVGDVGYRTDTILLVTLSPNQGVVSVTSFPRDLYVYIPGWTMQRINTAQFHGGFDLMAATFEYNFGVHPDYYFMVNFQGFTNIIDSLGGIYVDVGKTISDHRDGYGEYTVYAGQVLMDGQTALWYARARKASSDYDRTRRQQEVLVAIFNRLISLDAVKRAPELFDQFRSNVETNVELSQMLPYLGLASKVGSDTSLITRYAVGANQVIPYRVPSSGAQVLLPQRELILEIMRQALHAP